MEEEFGSLEWLGFLKTYFRSSEQTFLINSVGEYSILLLKEKEEAEVFLRLDVGQDDII